MMGRKTWLGLAAIPCVFLGFRLLAFDQPPADVNQQGHLPALMLAKLSNTQRVVAGLVSKNFPEIVRGAEDMIRICDAEQWDPHPDPVFTQHRRELRSQASKLIDLANSHNLEGAAFNYIQTVSTCINCHEHCRDVLRIAEIPSSNRVISIPTTDNDSNWTGMPTLRR